MLPGAPADDAPWPSSKDDDGGGWLLDRLGGGFVLLLFSHAPSPAEQAVMDALADAPVPVRSVLVAPEGSVAQRYDGQPGTAYLIRPDQIVAARWRRLDLGAVRAALARAIGKAASR
jgi:3-(3-hydroxy-phenyl)propionate hydroxylase